MSKRNSDGNRNKGIDRLRPTAPVWCVVLFVLVGCGPSEQTVERTTDQTKLAKIALEDKDAEVRRAAVAKLTDQALLAKIAVEAKDADVRSAAVAKLTDQALLAKIAAEDKDLNVCRAAMEKLRLVHNRARESLGLRQGGGVR